MKRKQIESNGKQTICTIGDEHSQHVMCVRARRFLFRHPFYRSKSVNNAKSNMSRTHQIEERAICFSPSKSSKQKKNMKKEITNYPVVG